MTKYVDGLMVKDGKEMIEFYHRAINMEYEIKLQKDKTGQYQRLTRRFPHELQKMIEYKSELRDITKAMKRFSQKPSCISNSIPLTIDNTLEELELLMFV